MKNQLLFPVDAQNGHTVCKNRKTDGTVCKNTQNTVKNVYTVCKNEKFESINAVSESLQNSKRALRTRLIRARDAMSKAEREIADKQIVSHVLSLPCFKNASALLLYAPVGSEIDIFPLMREAWQNAVPVGLPVCDRATKTVAFLSALPNIPLVRGAFGIPVPPETAEPIEPDEKTVCILPALAYDQNRVRLGYGGGYYDRFLADFCGISVGVAYERTVLGSVCAEPHDRAVSILVTESGVY